MPRTTLRCVVAGCVAFTMVAQASPQTPGARETRGGSACADLRSLTFEGNTSIVAATPVTSGTVCSRSVIRFSQVSQWRSGTW